MAKCPGVWRGERGSVTVEFALALPALVLVLGLMLSACRWAMDVAVAQSAAGEAARVAITSSDADAEAVGRRISPGAAVTVSRGDGSITACVTVERHPWPGGTRCAIAADRP